MGQRHQVYLRLPAKYYNEKNPNNKPETTIGLHHQWMWGARAIKMLKNLITYHTNSDEYGAFKNSIAGEPQSTFEALYSVDAEDGYNHRVHTLDQDCCENPLLGDNNNGITIIDMSNPEKPAYCFMSIHHLECLDDSKEAEAENFKPYDVKEYIGLHYPDWNKETKDPEEVKFYGDVKKSVEYLENFDLLTIERVYEIFPRMFQEGFEEYNPS